MPPVPSSVGAAKGRETFCHVPGARNSPPMALTPHTPSCLLSRNQDQVLLEASPPPDHIKLLDFCCLVCSCLRFLSSNTATGVSALGRLWNLTATGGCRGDVSASPPTNCQRTAQPSKAAFPLQALGENPSLLLPTSVAPGNPWFMAVSLQPQPLSSHGMALSSLCVSYVDTSCWV